MRRAWIEEKIAKTEALIDAYEDALAAFAADGSIQSYSIDTGQTTQSVSRAQIASVRLLLDGLYSRLSDLCARQEGRTIIARPSF